jgi:DNA-binding MarR family transcriptional regulator
MSRVVRNEEHQNQGTFIADRLGGGFQTIIKYVNRRLGEEGFTDIRPAHMTIFQNLSPEGSRIGELAQRTGLTNQSVGYLVDYLESHDYMERRPDPTHRRATLVCLTDHGWEAMRACGAILDEIGAHLRDHLGAKNLDDLERLLLQLDEGLQGLR